MKTLPCGRLFACGLLCILIPLARHCALAQAVTISSFTVALDGSRQLRFAGGTDDYYVLYRGATVANISMPVQVVLGVEPETAMQDTSAQTSAGFYRVRTVPRSAPLDLDGDGVDDVAELQAGTNPLVPNTPAGHSSSTKWITISRARTLPSSSKSSTQPRGR